MRPGFLRAKGNRGDDVVALVAGPRVGAVPDAKVVETDALSLELLHGARNDHLAQVERLPGDVVVNDVGLAEVEAEELQGVHDPVVEHLVLEEHVVLRDISVVVAAGRDELEADLAEDVGQVQEHGHGVHHAVSGLGDVSGEQRANGAADRSDEDREVDDRGNEDVEAGKGLPDLDVVGDLEDDEVGTEGGQGDEKLLETNGETEADEALLNIYDLAAGLVVLEVEGLAPPGVGAEFAHPDEGEHDVLDKLHLLEVEVVDKIVLEFVEERREEGHQGHHGVPGDRVVQPEVCRAGDTGETSQKPGHAKSVLVLQPGVLLPQTLVLGVDSLADSVDAGLVGVARLLLDNRSIRARALDNGRGRLHRFGLRKIHG
mmetsp:Transcript_14030/g.55289  ORF Transcript_14030/g.55289 Transcript_14030/m.55289 type:complete len:373 (+) Transcript_14030:95-1213(+)